MNEASLRQAIIKLAQEQPNLRQHLLPILKTAYGMSVKRLRDGRIVVNAGPRYQGMAKTILKRIGVWDFVDIQMGSWFFPANLDEKEIFEALNYSGGAVMK